MVTYVNTSAEVKAETDISALGIVLYGLLVGGHPLQDTPTGELVVKHLQAVGIKAEGKEGEKSYIGQRNSAQEQDSTMWMVDRTLEGKQANFLPVVGSDAKREMCKSDTPRNESRAIMRPILHASPAHCEGLP